MTRSIRPSSARRCSRAADCGAARNFGPAMHDEDPLGDLGQRQRPIDRRIAAAGDDDPLAAKLLAPPHQIEHALLLELGDAGERRPVRAERAGPGRDDDGAGGNPRPGGGLDREPAIAGRGEARHGMRRDGMPAQTARPAPSADRSARRRRFAGSPECRRSAFPDRARRIVRRARAARRRHGSPCRACRTRRPRKARPVRRR